MPKYMLTYKFHFYTIHLEEKSVEDRFETYETFEDLLADYRKKKNSLFMELFHFNTDFHFYALQAKEQDISVLDNLL